ncbi:MAG: AAA family ATPase [Bacteroidaceae bacterium]|nr:AAA family ATPase [Bacteroidaceae bacterium]
MKIRRIYAENYKTYRKLDLNLEVTDDRPIILIGGANGCGKTTLFDAIYSALYGLEIKNKRQFEEIFNAGVKNEEGMDRKNIVLEVTFTGVVLGKTTPYKLKRSYTLMDGSVRESVELNMDGNRFIYGSGSTAAQRNTNEEIVNKIIAANLPRELSNYFLFDAMKTSELVKEEQINKLIMKNINSVMGFNKYSRLRSMSEALLAEKKAAKLENEMQRKDYENLQRQKAEKEAELLRKKEEYSQALAYANEHREMYNRAKEGRDDDDVMRDKIRQIEQNLRDFDKKEADYRQEADGIARELESKVLFPKLADMVRGEVELILNEKSRIAAEHSNDLTNSQIERVTNDVVDYLKTHHFGIGRIDVSAIVSYLIAHKNDGKKSDDKYPNLSDTDVKVLGDLVKAAYVNPFVMLDEKRTGLNLEIDELPHRRKQLNEFRQTLLGADYSIIEMYESNDKNTKELKFAIDQLTKEIETLSKKIATYDYDIPQVPDPQYDMLCKLPDFFKSLSVKLLAAKKASIERMMRDQLNINLVIYAGYIGRVELSAGNADEISFKIYHKNGNEIYLSQLNAGAKQTVMQVLLKVLYELGDYDPPVMIDTVMGVLDKESREVILEQYFPDLAHQTILLSTDTEITTERDFKKVEAYVARTYTLHRDKEQQCTTVSEDYFGEQLMD